MQKLRTYVSGGVLGVLLGLGIFLMSCYKSGPEKQGAEFGEPFTIEQGDVVKELVVSAVISSQHSIAVYVPKVSHFWEFNVSWVAQEGSRVKKGDPIVRLDDSALKKELQDAKLKLQSSQLEFEAAKIRGKDQIESVESEIELSKLEVEKQKLLVVHNDSVSLNETKKQQINVAAAQNTYANNKEKLKNAKQEVERKLESQRLEMENAQSEMNDLSAAMAEMEIKAPQDGILILPYFASGAGLVKARQGIKVQINTVIAEVHDTSALIAKLYVPEVDADGIVPETTGILQLNYLPDQIFAGKTVSISNIPSTPAERQGRQSTNVADNIKQYEVIFAVTALPAPVVPGMTGSAKLTLKKADNVVRVPIDALALAPAKKGGTIIPLGAQISSDEAYVYRQKRGKSSYDWVKVELGATSYGYAEIKQGLEVGDRVKSILW